MPNRKAIARRKFETGTDWDDPRTGKEKAEAFKVQQLAGGHTTKTIEKSEHEVIVEVY